MKIKEEKEDKEEGMKVQEGEDLQEIKIKQEVMEEEVIEEEEKKNVEEDKEDGGVEETKAPEPANKGQAEPEMGRLVMTIGSEQKMLSFTAKDLLTTATMLVGDKVRIELALIRVGSVVRSVNLSPTLVLKVRFSIATHQETKEEQAVFIEILADSFVESNEQRQHVRF